MRLMRQRELLPTLVATLKDYTGPPLSGAVKQAQDGMRKEQEAAAAAAAAAVVAVGAAVRRCC
jgi:hypothetical protein